ncbi:hypothetical protein AB0G86_45730, partial [Streptomyces scabiei]
MTRGQYVDPSAGKVTFKAFATAWLASQATDPSTIVNMELRFRLHAFPYIGPTDLFVSSVGVVGVWVEGCRGGISTFPFGCRL